MQTYMGYGWGRIVMKTRCLTVWLCRKRQIILPGWSVRLCEQGIGFGGKTRQKGIAENEPASLFEMRFFMDRSFTITDIPGFRGYPGQPHRLRHPDISALRFHGAHFFYLHSMLQIPLRTVR